MFGISYYYSVNGIFKMQLFDTEEDAKLWFIDELFTNNILHYWFDGLFDGDEDDYYKCTEYYEKDDIKNCLLKTDLKNIIKRLKYLISIEVIIVEK